MLRAQQDPPRLALGPKTSARSGGRVFNSGTRCRNEDGGDTSLGILLGSERLPRGEHSALPGLEPESVVAARILIDLKLARHGGALQR
jgi:hypothetical protein